MIVGRLFGWMLIALGGLSASAEAVVAIGSGGSGGLATGDLVTLISGQSPFGDGAAFGVWLMSLPAWLAMGLTGAALLMVFRKRERRTFLRNASRCS